jgi:Carboxypeptidase regulatory-like domain
MSYRQCRRSIATRLAVVVLLLAGGCGMRPLEGTIIGTNGQPIPGLIVTLEVGTNGGLQKSRVTNEIGGFSFGSISTFGGCTIRFEKAGYQSQNVPCPSDGLPIRAVMHEAGHPI